MRLLHTSDWHLGCSLFGRKRYEEQLTFLEWLIELVRDERIDILLVSGDVFDSSSPSNRAQELYYNFLHLVNLTDCRHVVIIGGNHDSPTLLNAPGELLKYLNIHVVGCMTDSAEDEVLLLKDDAGKAQLFVCAVPFLRERDLRFVESGESIANKEEKLIAGIKKHYQDVFTHSFSLAQKLPVIAMGHLFAKGASLSDGEAVRDLYIGNLAQVADSVFPKELSYIALGHLHRQQSVGKRANCRYSGSPIPLSFKEAESDKQVLIVDIKGAKATIKAVKVPQTVKLVQIDGDWDEINRVLESLLTESLPCWLDINYTGFDLRSDLKQDVLDLIEDSDIELLRLRNERITQKALSRQKLEETLDDLDPQEVFKRCLERHKIEAPLAKELCACYNEVLQSLADRDANAE